MDVPFFFLISRLSVLDWPSTTLAPPRRNPSGCLSHPHYSLWLAPGLLPGHPHQPSSSPLPSSPCPAHNSNLLPRRVWPRRWETLTCSAYACTLMMTGDLSDSSSSVSMGAWFHRLDKETPDPKGCRVRDKLWAKGKAWGWLCPSSPLFGEVVTWGNPGVSSPGQICLY